MGKTIRMNAQGAVIRTTVGGLKKMVSEALGAKPVSAKPKMSKSQLRNRLDSLWSEVGDAYYSDDAEAEAVELAKALSTELNVPVEAAQSVIDSFLYTYDHNDPSDHVLVNDRIRDGIAELFPLLGNASAATEGQSLVAELDQIATEWVTKMAGNVTIDTAKARGKELQATYKAPLTDIWVMLSYANYKNDEPGDKYTEQRKEVYEKLLKKVAMYGKKKK